MKSKDRIESFSIFMDRLYEFASMSNAYQHIPRTYGTDDVLFMAEVHLLQQIKNYEGITTVQLAALRRKSPSSISQLVNKLLKKGLIVKIADSEDKKCFHLFLSEKGECINKYHEEFDAKLYASTLAKIPQLTDEEIENFTAILEIVINEIHKSQ